MACSVLCAAGSTAWAADGGRFALVVANDTYPPVNVMIPSVGGDARSLAEVLKRLGYDTELDENATQADLKAAFDRLVAKVTAGSVVFLYFGGLGIQVGDRDYLLPVDAQLWSEDDAKRAGTSLDTVLDDLQHHGATTKFLVVDAARHNPYERRFRADSAGLSAIRPPEGTWALLSAEPGKTTPVAAGSHSLFMDQLLPRLADRTSTAKKAFAATRDGVARASGQGVPWSVFTSTVDVDFTGRSLTSGIASSERSVAPAQPQVAAIGKPANPVSPALARPQTLRDCSDCPELTIVPSGRFDMGAPGSPMSLPVHGVTIGKPLAMSTNPITFDDWDKCVRGNGCTFRPKDFGWGGGRQPVVNVSWSDAKGYVAWLSKVGGNPYRLPSESEWEYAARAGTTTTYPWGSDLGADLADCRNCGSQRIGRPKPVGSFPPNRFGLNDMAGNVAEWVEDCWNDSYRGAPSDGSAWTSGNCDFHVLRGGSFDSTSDYIKPTTRFRYDTDVRYFANGFRVVRTLVP